MWLGIDTTTERLGLALYDSHTGYSDVLTLFAYRDMAAVLHPHLKTLCKAAGITPAMLKGIGVTYGPGSYTGVRLGLAAAKGLALVADIPVVGLNAQQIIAEPLLHQNLPVAVVSRANAGDVYYALFAADGKETHSTALVAADAVSAMLPQACVLTGNAAGTLEGLGEEVVLRLEEADIYADPLRIARAAIHAQEAGHAEEAAPMYLQPLAYRKSPGLKS